MIDQWFPVSKDMGLIDAPINRVVDELINWHTEIDIEYSRRDIGDSFEGALETLPPLSIEMRRKLFVPTVSGWVAYFQSGIDGSDPAPELSILTERLGVLSMRVCVTPVDAVWPAVIWEVYAPEHLGGKPPRYYKRSICVSNDGGTWVFEHRGEPFPFEKQERYRRNCKRDRFTGEHLREYLGEFQLDPFSDAFYLVRPESPATLLERKSRWKRRVPEYSLEQVVNNLPWEKK